MALKLIITAGGGLPPDMRGQGHPGNKALLRVGQASLLERALDAGSELHGAQQLVVVGDQEVQRNLPAGIAHRLAGGSVVDNLVRGFEHHGGAAHDYLVLSSDLPFVASPALSRFLAEAQSADADLAVPVVSRGTFLARFPGAPNKFELVDGREVTMGSAFFLKGALLQANIPLMRDFVRFRKSPLKLAALLGWGVLWGFLTKKIRLAVLERRASTLTGGVVRAVESDAPELAFDIDTAAEYEFALRQSR